MLSNGCLVLAALSLSLSFFEVSEWAASDPVTIGLYETLLFRLLWMTGSVTTSKKQDAPRWWRAVAALFIPLWEVFC